MVKKLVLAMAFVAAFSAVGFTYTTSAQAWRGWGRPVYYGAPYVAPGPSYYAPYNAYYGAPVVVARPYRTYYAPAPYYYGY